MEKHERRWDVIVVGARCAGASLAAHLARAGVKTLLLEASPRGTDMPMSTHYIQPPGMAALERLGVAAQLCANAPAAHRFRVALDEEAVVARNPEQQPGYCIRRSTLDPLLQEVAENSGAEFRDRTRVTGLVWDAERVRGVTVRTAAGNETLHADVVIGADGQHSTIAKLTRVEEYWVEHGSRAGYWGYYPAPERWSEEWDATVEHRGDMLRYVFRADGDLLVMVAVTTQPEASSWGKAYREKLHEALLGSPTTASLVEGKSPVGDVIGLLKTRFFYRRPIGPGFALAGDAGHFKDFVTGQGITDALLDAERLAEAILDGRHVAYEHYWRERDVATMPLHFDAVRQGRVGYNSAFNRWIFKNLARRADVLQNFRQVAARELEPSQLIPTRTLLGWMASAGVRGRFDVLRGFLETGKQLSVEEKELKLRRRLLAEAKAALLAPGPARDARTTPASLPRREPFARSA
ncbi:MAG TPA: NAD(P)/FAD-dependent oxidoreductase [Polyangiaceae bacterium]|nr:NAD(P)/FAD-dependent oxidoreductase [Polyangiaceae bacterium]